MRSYYRRRESLVNYPRAMRVLATVALAVIAVAIAGCGGDEDTATPGTTETTTTTAQAGECDSVEAPEARADGGATAPTERLDPEQTWTLDFETSCGSFVVTLDHGRCACDGGLARVARRGRLLRRHGLPPDRARVRDPGRRSDPVGERRPRLLDGRRARLGHAGTPRASWRWRRPPPKPAGTAGSQFFVVTGDDVGLPPEYAVVGEVTDGLDVVEQIGTLGDPATEQPIQPDRRRVGHRRVVVSRVAAVVLAAGAATRFGSPKQRLLLPQVLERLAASAVDEVVVVEGAYDLRDTVSRCA